MNLIFRINLALIIAIIISLILIFFFKRGHCLLCCSWSLLYLFLLLILVIGALFLVVGLFIQNLASGIITFIHNINDLKSGEESDIAIDIIDNCFNRDGFLFHSNVFPKEFNITIIEAIYDLELTLEEEINDLNNFYFSSLSAAEILYNDIQLRLKK